jgi:hypothetical protein
VQNQGPNPPGYRFVEANHLDPNKSMICRDFGNNMIQFEQTKSTKLFSKQCKARTFEFDMGEQQFTLRIDQENGGVQTIKSS